MCSNPQRFGEFEVSCRKCNDCLKRRKSDWVARAMAEKATAVETFSIELTYRNNPDGTKPDAAKAFRYADVQAFLARLRKAYYDTYGEHGEVRYLIAGERGKQRDRVHWHLILYGDKRLSTLGQWSDFVFKPLPGPIITKLGNKAKMVHWSMWDHGHIVVKEPNLGGMAYCLKYVLKDQFNVVQSKGTMRESKAEIHGAGMFRMSKKPPIGMRWLVQQCDRWEERGAVPPSLELKIPGMKGYWWPQGMLRDYLIERLHDINEKVREETGREAPQWATLLLSVVDDEKTYEGLFYGEQPNLLDLERDQLDSEVKGIANDQAKRQEAQRRLTPIILPRCHDLKPCRSCWDAADKEARRKYRKEYERAFRNYESDYRAGKEVPDSFAAYWYQRGQENPLCQRK